MGLRDRVGRVDGAVEDDLDARAAQGGRRRAADRVPQVRRSVVVRVGCGAHRAGHDRRAPAGRGRGPTGTRSPRSRRCPGRRRRRRSPGPPGSGESRSAISNSFGNVKWLAGVRPRSIGTRSAMSSMPGARARMAAPSRVGTFPPATGSATMLIVPPVKMTATRLTCPARRSRRRGPRAPGAPRRGGAPRGASARVARGGSRAGSCSRRVQLRAGHDLRDDVAASSSGRIGPRLMIENSPDSDDERRDDQDHDGRADDGPRSGRR